MTGLSPRVSSRRAVGGIPAGSGVVGPASDPATTTALADAAIGWIRDLVIAALAPYRLLGLGATPTGFPPRIPTRWEGTAGHRTPGHAAPPSPRGGRDEVAGPSDPRAGHRPQAVHDRQ